MSIHRCNIIFILSLTLLFFIFPRYNLADHPDDQYWNDFPLPSETQVWGGVTALAEHDGKLWMAIVNCWGFEWCEWYYYEIFTWDSAGWAATIAFPIGLDGEVEDMISYNGDLIICGSFSNIDNDSISYIARWDGDRWYTLGDGVDSSISDLTIYNGDLIVGGRFTTAGSSDARGIARWDGSAWHTLDLGINGIINDMTEYGGELVVGGLFDTAGGIPVSNIASWNGSNWSNFVGGGVNNTINALEVYNSELYLGGLFQNPGTYFIKWNGYEWWSLEFGYAPTDQINDLLVFDNKLIIAGEFHSIGGESISRIASWNGSIFSSMETTIAPEYPNILIEFENKLVCGALDYGMHGPSGCIMYWTGTEWRFLRTNIEGSFATITEYNNEMIVGGNFYMEYFYKPEIYKIARWDGLEWNQMGYLNDDVLVLTIYNGELLAGGDFFMPSDSAGGLARFNGTDWELFEGGVSRNYYSTYISVDAITEYNGDMVIGGNFQKAGDVEANSIARWDGYNWNPLGTGVLGRVYTLAVYDGDLYVGGNFNEAGEIAVPGLARWDGSEWHKLEGFISSLDHYVYDLLVYNGELHIGGWFRYTIPSKATLCNDLARWDGANLNPVEPTLIPSEDQYSQVRDLEIYNNELYVGGNFNFSGDRIARYNGMYWRTLGSGFGGSSSVYGMSVLDDELIVGGYKKIASWSKPISCCVLRGDALHDNQLILVNDLVYLVNYVFKGGPPPICPEEGDALADNGLILVNDLVFLVNYVFKGGDAPPLC